MMEISVQQSNNNSSSNHSATSELEKHINELEINEKGSHDTNGSSNGVDNNLSNEKLNTLKKRISSSKTPNRTTTKARRVRFFRNGDKFWTGYLVAVSQERYKYVYATYFEFIIRTTKLTTFSRTLPPFSFATECVSNLIIR
jgi:hypothetical protein